MKVSTSASTETAFDEAKFKPLSAKEEINQRTALEFAGRAKAVADDILGPEGSTYAKPREHIGSVKVYHYHDYGWGWYSSPVYIIDGGTGRHTRNDDDSGARLLLGLLAAVVGGFALYHLGTAIKHFREASQELKEIRPFTYWSIVAKSSDNSNLSFCKTIEKIAEIESRIFSRIKHQAGWKLTEAAGITAGCALTLVGAIYGVQAYVASGVVLGCAFGGSMLLRWGMDSTERDLQCDARALRSALAVL